MKVLTLKIHQAAEKICSFFLIYILIYENDRGKEEQGNIMDGNKILFEKE